MFFYLAVLLLLAVYILEKVKHRVLIPEWPIPLIALVVWALINLVVMGSVGYSANRTDIFTAQTKIAGSVAGSPAYFMAQRDLLSAHNMLEASRKADKWVCESWFSFWAPFYKYEEVVVE